jgi:cytochrome b6-f complex iron-sulfur subunit
MRMTNRRDFIKHSCTWCLGGLALGWLTAHLSACATIPYIKTDTAGGIITVPLASFTEKNKMVVVRNKQLEFDILVVKSADAFLALQMKCTHQDAPLTVNANGLFCPSHGSTFDLQGNVNKEPALKPLKRYKTELNESSVLIYP